MRARQVPDQDLPVQRAAVERRAVAADRQRGDPAVVAGEDLALRGVADVPDDDAAIGGGGDGEATVGGEDAALDDAVVLPEATRTFPVRRSAKRTEPSAPPSSSVCPSGLSAVYCVADRDAP